jgi:hypothetical protein
MKTITTNRQHGQSEHDFITTHKANHTRPRSPSLGMSDCIKTSYTLSFPGHLVELDLKYAILKGIHFSI